MIGVKEVFNLTLDQLQKIVKHHQVSEVKNAPTKAFLIHTGELDINNDEIWLYLAKVKGIGYELTDDEVYGLDYGVIFKGIEGLEKNIIWAIEKMLRQIKEKEERYMGKKKVYISGKITGSIGFMEKFAQAQKELEEKGYVVVNPALVNSNMPIGTTWDEYMKLSLVMLEMCTAIYMLEDWKDSLGAREEYRKALKWGKEIIFENPKDTVENSESISA